ncbi:MAG TPA: hypothetical protein VMF67_01920 [Rhizomicrobium sp.]|nr:hypothetical protein [Rhizomicrobium sp.]
MSIEISQENQARLAAEARRLGISENELLARFLSGHAGPAPTRPKPELPAWNLGAGSLHRRDIYDDAR